MINPRQCLAKYVKKHWYYSVVAKHRNRVAILQQKLARAETRASHIGADCKTKLKAAKRTYLLALYKEADPVMKKLFKARETANALKLVEQTRLEPHDARLKSLQKELGDVSEKLAMAQLKIDANPDFVLPDIDDEHKTLQRKREMLCNSVKLATTHCDRVRLIDLEAKEKNANECVQRFVMDVYQFSRYTKWWNIADMQRKTLDSCK